jgi:hypothetical protein
MATPRWLVLIHQIPPKPDYLRVRIGRDLRRLGAVAIKNSVYVAPATAAIREALALVVREVKRAGGDAMVCEASFVAGLSDAGVEERFRAVLAPAYAELAREAGRLAEQLARGKPAPQARSRSFAAELSRLKRRFGALVARDRFAAPGRERAAGLLALAEDRLQGVERRAASAMVAPAAKPPRAATWVTRRGVMVDRIASAWLIRRFIDPAARFRFVGGRGSRATRGELRFDMAGAEYTHAGERCTFEVLLDRFALADPALRAIGEIVHDLDLEDGRYGREEAAGVGRMIVGLSLAHDRDDVRLQHGAAIFDGLYESFRRRA